MTRLFARFREAIAFLVVGAFAAFLAGQALAQQIPIPSDVCTAGQMPYAVDVSNLKCTSDADDVSAIFVTGTVTTTEFTLAANTCTEIAYSLTGLTTSHKVFINPQFVSGTEGFYASARVAAADAVELTICNYTGDVTDPEVGSVAVVAILS